MRRNISRGRVSCQPPLPRGNADLRSEPTTTLTPHPYGRTPSARSAATSQRDPIPRRRRKSHDRQHCDRQHHRFPVHGSDGDKIGSVEQVYVADETGTPVWATVRTGLFGTSESFVPLEGASFDDGRLSVAYDKSFVKDAPRIDADGALNADEEADLYRYYNLTGAASASATENVDSAAGFGGADADLDAARTTGIDTNVGHDTSDP
ncbi:PRC-barrel domain-containing protein [Rathayibacter oskolensis]|uniref:PRC-barrel domain-containing protein n=1 Tax=Rathayibacter oskolensis TaxID=1891671 RepID=UPI0034673104